MVWLHGWEKYFKIVYVFKTEKRVWKETRTVDICHLQEGKGMGERGGSLYFSLYTSEFFESITHLIPNKENEKTHISNK